MTWCRGGGGLCPPITSQPVRSTISAECFRVDLVDGTAAALGLPFSAPLARRPGAESSTGQGRAPPIASTALRSHSGWCRAAARCRRRRPPTAAAAWSTPSSSGSRRTARSSPASTASRSGSPRPAIRGSNGCGGEMDTILAPPRPSSSARRRPRASLDRRRRRGRRRRGSGHRPPREDEPGGRDEGRRRRGPDAAGRGESGAGPASTGCPHRPVRISTQPARPAECGTGGPSWPRPSCSAGRSTVSSAGPPRPGYAAPT